MDVEDATKLSYDIFCTRYMTCNRPVLLRNVTPTWFPKTRKWHDEHGINHTFLREHYGTELATVASGEVIEYEAEDRRTMRLADYLDLYKSGQVGKKYLKDWHFVYTFGHDMYETPPFFKDDWLNWWWDHKEQSESDYRFVYIGPAGSWTPLHQDVFRSYRYCLAIVTTMLAPDYHAYSWSVNICGRKEWIFYHPDDVRVILALPGCKSYITAKQEPKLKDRFGYVVPDVTVENIDEEKYPQLHEARRVYIIQESGEAVFVPSGWYHQVKNLEDTISINHNWFNGYNIREVWRFLKLDYAAVVHELEDLKEIGLVGRDFADQCQRIMYANTGINYVEFRELLYAKASDLLKISDCNCLKAKSDLILHLKYVRGILQELNAVLKALDEGGKVKETWPDIDLQLANLDSRLINFNVEKGSR